MKNKKGFTLIELLAVIAILAIIAVIATPMVLDVIEDSRIKSAESSAQAAWDAAETYQGRYATDNAGTFLGSVSVSDLKTNVNYASLEGSNVTAGSFSFDANGNISGLGTNLTVDGYTCTFGTPANKSDVICIE